jgi:hypothetical protein
LFAGSGAEEDKTVFCLAAQTAKREGELKVDKTDFWKGQLYFE